MKFLLSCTLLAVISFAAAQQYPFQGDQNLASLPYYPALANPQPSYGINRPIQYQEYHQRSYQRQQNRQPIPAGQSTLFRAPSSSVDTSYTEYKGGNITPQQKLVPNLTAQPVAALPDITTNPRKTQTLSPEINVVSAAYKRPKVVEDELESDEDNIDLNAINDSATRATMLWRAMSAKHPDVAAKAAMYWRVKAVRDSKSAAEDAMAARKMIATGPEEMARAALEGVEGHHIAKRRSSSDSIHSQSRLPPYWREFAAHDPEVTARSAMYWVNDSQADMYW